MSKHTVIKSKYLASSLGFLGFRFELRYDEQGKTIYIFNETPEFIEALHTLMKLKDIYRK